MTDSDRDPPMITAAELDRLFDGGADIDAHVDWAKARRPGLEPKALDVALPAWMVEALDREAARSGLTRRTVVEAWIAEKLDETKKPADAA